MAAAELYQAGQGDLPSLLRCYDAFVSQQRIFIADVCDYNHRIADYVLSVLDRPATSQALVDMLIVTEHSKGARPAPAKPGRNGAVNAPLAPAGSAGRFQRRPCGVGLRNPFPRIRPATEEAQIDPQAVQRRPGRRPSPGPSAPSDRPSDAPAAPSLLPHPRAR